MLTSAAIFDAAPAPRRNLIVEGRIEAAVPLHVHGIAVGAAGRVRADIYATVIRVEGEVVGDLFGAAQVRVCAPGTVHGNITAPEVIVESGARFEGRISMRLPAAFIEPTQDDERPIGLGA